MQSGSVVERPNGAYGGDGGFGESSDSSATATSAAGSRGGDGGSEGGSEAPPPPVVAPGLFESVAVEWQRLRLAVQDI